MVITVERLLAQIQDREMRCVAGFRGLSNPISGFTIVDTPDIVHWIKGGEFVTSLGYITSIHPDMRKTLIHDLAAKGCAGLGLKKDCYYKDTPPEYIEQANLLDFPIVEMPYNLRFSDVAYHIHQNIFAQNMSVMERTYQMYQKIMSLALDEASVEHMLYDISQIVRNPVVLANKDLEAVSFEIPLDNGADLSKYITLKRGAPILPRSTQHMVNARYQETRFASCRMALGETGLNIMYIPVCCERELWGFLLIPETVEALDSEQCRILENITSAVSIYFMKNQFSPADGTEGNSFFHFVLMNTRGNVESIRYYCKLFDFDYTCKRICIDIRPEGWSNLAYERRRSVRDLTNCSLTDLCAKHGIHHYPVSCDDHFVAFLLFGENVTPEDALLKTEMLAEELQTQFSGHNTPVQIGISACSSDILQIPSAYRQALEVVQLGGRIQPEMSVHSFEKLKVYYTLSSTLTEEELRDLADVVLELHELDTSGGTDYINTLELFIGNKFNATKTASEMFIHRNSMIYRLGRIRDILSVDLEDPEETLKIQLGLRALKLLKTIH